MYEKTQKTVNNPTHLIVCSHHVRSVVRATIRGNWCMVRTTVKLKNAAITRIIRYILLADSDESIDRLLLFQQRGGVVAPLRYRAGSSSRA